MKIEVCSVRQSNRKVWFHYSRGIVVCEMDATKCCEYDGSIEKNFYSPNIYPIYIISPTRMNVSFYS